LRKFIAHITLLLVCTVAVFAQSPRFYLGFDQILDNREYFTDYGYPQTIFGARINLGASVTFDSTHSIHAGINYMYEYGSEFLGVKPQIDLYYSFRANGLDLFVGSFPRRERMDYPLMLLTDSLDYFRPNMEGASVRYSWDWGTVHGWVDWTGRETQEIRESILAGFDASARMGVFYLTAMATRYHLAHTTTSDGINQIRDDGSIVVMAGVDLSDRVFFDRLNVSTGVASTYLYDRPADFVWNQGWLSRLDMKYKIFGIIGSWYLGDPSPLLYGDRLYSHGDYGRLDFYVSPFRNPRISSKIGWNLHFLPGEGVYHSQQFLISIRL
jgi:hypothetical protein